MYAMKVGITAPTPGIRPSRKPMTVPRQIAPLERFHSSRLGHRSVIFVSTICRNGVFDDEQDLGHAEESHDDRNETEAVVELGDAEA